MGRLLRFSSVFTHALRVWSVGNDLSGNAPLQAIQAIRGYSLAQEQDTYLVEDFAEAS